MINFNLSLFRTYVRVVETQNLSRTAEELNLSQPAVSKQIQALEEKFGVLLLERSGRRLKTTEAGEALYECAGEVLRVMEKTIRIMEDISENRRGNLFLGASTIPGQYILPAYLKGFKEKYPNVTINMEVADTEKIINKVSEREIDLGVVGACTEGSKIDGFKWMDDELVVVVPNHHRLAGKELVELKGLTSERWIFREKGSGTRVANEEILSASGVAWEDLNIQAELGSTEAVVAAVEADLGIAMVSERVAQQWSQNGRIAALKIKEGATRGIFVILPRQKHRRQTVENFLHYLRQGLF